MTQQEITPGAAVAVMRVLGDEVKAQTAAVRDTAQDEFKQLRAAGVKSMQAQLPTGAEVGRISIRDASPVVRWNGPKLAEFVEATAPIELVDRVDSAVLGDPELILWVLQNRPGMVRAEVRDSYRDKLKKRLTADGELVDESTGELFKVAEIDRPEPTGAFSYVPSDGAREEVLGAWRSGALAGMGGVFASLGAPAVPTETPSLDPAEPTDTPLTREFTRAELESLGVPFDLTADVEVSREIIDQRRWSTVWELLFRHEGRVWQIHYETGSTEYQDVPPFAGDTVTATALEERPVLTLQWVPVDQVAAEVAE
ncbi:hypothetical protein [Nocardiopsis sp. HUAS JQ3]|uniref:hypothetical protein n=1 Tax=Nocardiopsis sp. HUAS JQ3 TaxID=3061629 RepID=UPI0023A925BE|nr:hypothetical protein [Nocardiopsis sp. HUAS JQ3]WDZ91170.1 hypothetical protein PV789_00910 [Nocardiopsis sp. HUAS JQ3]